MSHARRADWAASVPWSGITGVPDSVTSPEDIGQLKGAGFSAGDVPVWNGTNFGPASYNPGSSGGGPAGIVELDSPGVATKRINPSTGEFEYVWLREVFDVRQYGADPTGGIDASAAFNAAISDLNASGGGALIVPVGRYTISSVLNRITARCWVHGDGQGSTILTVAGDGFWVVSGSFFGCTGLTLNGSNIVGTGITIIDAATRDNFMLTDLRLSGFGYGIKVDTVLRSGWMDRVRIDATELALSFNASDSFVHSVAIYNGGDNTKNAFEMTGTRNQVTDFKLLGNGTNFKKGLFVNDGGSHMISDGMIIGCDEEAISLSNGTGGVEGCRVQNISWLDIGTAPSVVSYDATTNFVDNLYEIGTAGDPGGSGGGTIDGGNFTDPFTPYINDVDGGTF